MFFFLDKKSPACRLEVREQQPERQDNPELEVQQGGTFDADNKGPAIESGQHRAHIEEGQGKSNPDEQGVDGQPAENDEKAHGQVASDQQAGVIPSAKGLAA